MVYNEPDNKRFQSPLTIRENLLAGMAEVSAALYFDEHHNNVKWPPGLSFMSGVSRSYSVAT